MNEKKAKYKELYIEHIRGILGLTIKEDDVNKVITFLVFLSAFTEESQMNVSFNAPSSTGKTYLPLQIASLFPECSVKTIGHCSPTAFFHDVSAQDEKNDCLVADLSRSILIFLDQPHNQLLEYLRPILSHDKKEIMIKITVKKKGYGLRTKNILIIGYPVVIFCSAGLKIDEQESTRFFLLSPEISQSKIRQAVNEKVKKETDRVAYNSQLEANPNRQLLMERIEAIRDEHITYININSPDKLQDRFLSMRKRLKPRHSRDIGRLIALVKAFALLNLWHRERDGSIITANDRDIDSAFILWEGISQSQENNIPPYIFDFYSEIIYPLCNGKDTGVTRGEIIRKYFEVRESTIPDWQLRREILPMLEMAGLIIQEQDPDDKRRMLISVPQVEAKTDMETDIPESVFNPFTGAGIAKDKDESDRIKYGYLEDLTEYPLVIVPATGVMDDAEIPF